MDGSSSTSRQISWASMVSPKLTYLSLRYGGHISAALWIASASWQAIGTARIVGWLLAFDLAIYSFIAWWDAFSHGKGYTSRHTMMLQSCVKK